MNGRAFRRQKERATAMLLRRRLFVLCILILTITAVQSFVHVLSGDGLSALDLALTAVFVPLAAWLAQSFCTLTAGALMIATQRFSWRRRRDEMADIASGLVDSLPRVAIVMPVYNEDSGRVFAGVAAMRDELRALGVAKRFDVFILSDSTDGDNWLAEEEAWDSERHRVGDSPRLFYRRRFRNIKRKTGNIGQFVERHGAAYGYMVVLDADSLMSGEAIWVLTRRMDAERRTALIQAPPKLIMGDTPFSRMLQFAGDVYGPLSSAGLAFWAGGEGNYWGHNAIIRVDAFAACCGLPALPGRAPLGGDILSHDFVEAALLRRAGWKVRIAWDLGGSYEEPPPTMEDFMVRDRRWCQGNMQHGRILFARGLHGVSRSHLLIGIMSYVTSPLWLIFLILSGMQAWTLARAKAVYFQQGVPWATWPISREEEAAYLLAGTLGMLFLPKIWGLLLAIFHGPTRRSHGGGLALVGGFFLENLISALVAPIMMIRHSQFVVSILTGAKVDWKPQRRTADKGNLRVALASYKDVMVIGIAAVAFVLWAAPSLGVWLSPVLAGLLGAPFLAMALGDPDLGAALRRRGLLVIPEEVTPPSVLTRMEERLAARPPTAEAPESRFSRVILDPDTNARHRALIQATGEAPTAPVEVMERAVGLAIHLGPEALGKDERKALLECPERLEQLHVACWARRLEDRGGVAPG
ncbi:glucans biosynthesis glucosyltransferase MdoH [Rhodospirillum rubrum]|uniref:glucans biosynthesis glucosyltransferase MdoH n=1 Tax=Rhodospirillum rubrum TaxID=1085 RepID=UPI0027DE8EB7|nr:glucans biosynthesis glucosyltransferase MdoH [Rhodospirillum rubrum]